MGKSLTPGSSEHKKYEKIMARRDAEMREWEKKYCTPEQLIDTPERLLKWIRQALVTIWWEREVTKKNDIFDIQKKYDEARDYAIELFEKNRALPKPPPTESDPLFGLKKVQDWCILTKKKGMAKKIIGWIFKKTSHFIFAVFVTVVGTVIAAIVVDIFVDFGWFERIKTIVHNILTNK